MFLGCPVPVDFQDYPGEAEELADLLADNRIAEMAEMNEKMLTEVFAGIDPETFDLDLTGHEKEEYAKITAALESGIEAAEEKERVDLSDKVGAVYEIIVECIDEEDQRQTYEALTKEGYECRVLTL